MAEPREVDVVTEAGEHVGKVDVRDTGKLPAGLRIASGPEAQRIGIQERFSSIPAKAAVAASAAVDELPFGVGTGAMEALLPGFARYYKEGQSVSPGATALGRGLGIGINIAMTGGPFAAAEEQLAVRGIGPVSRLAALGAAEGAVTGAGYGLSEAVVDNELNGEKIAASIMFGAGAGGILGGGAGLIVGRGKRALAKAADSPGEEAAAVALRSQFGSAPRRAVEALAEKVADASAFVSGKDRNAVRMMLGATEESAKARRLATEAVERRPQIIDDMARQIDEVEEADDVLKPIIQKAPLKQAKVARLVRVDNPGEQVAALQAEVTKLHDALGETDRIYGKWGSSTDIGNVAKKTLKDLDEAVQAGKKDISARIYSAADQFKRELGTHADAASGVASRRGGMKWMKRHEVLDDAYHRFRSMLEDDVLFGDAAKMQRAVNEPLSEFMAARNKYSEKFLTDGVKRSASNPWRNQTVADRGKLESYFDSIVDPKTDLAHQALRTVHDSKGRVVDALVEYADLSPAQLAAANKMKAASGRLLAGTEAATELITSHNMMKQLGDPGGGMLNATMLGGMLGGPGGGLAALALSTLTHPARTARQIAAVESVARSWGKKGTEEVAQLATRGRKLPNALTGVRLTRRAADLGLRELERTKASIATYRRDEAVNRYALEQSVSLVAPMAPKAAAAAVSTYEAGIAYLEKHLPILGKGMHVGAVERKPSVSEVSRYLRRVRAVEDPESVLRDVAKGKVSVEAVDTLRNVYPGIYGEVRVKVLTSMAEMEARGERHSYRDRLQFSLLLDMPTDATLTPEFMQRAQMVYKQMAANFSPQKQKKRGGGGGGGGKAQPSLSEAYETGSDNVAE